MQEPVYGPSSHCAGEGTEQCISPSTAISADPVHISCSIAEARVIMLQEVKLYTQDQEKESKKVAEMRAAGADPHDIRHAVGTAALTDPCLGVGADA